MYPPLYIVACSKFVVDNNTSCVYLINSGSMFGFSNFDFKTGKKTSSQKVDYAESKDNTFAGTYESAKKIEVRSGAGEDKNVLTILDKDTQVRCYGYYTEEDDEKWLYVEYVYNGITETGFCNINCLK